MKYHFNHFNCHVGVIVQVSCIRLFDRLSFMHLIDLFILSYALNPLGVYMRTCQEWSCY